MNTLAIRSHATLAASLVVVFWALAAGGVVASQQIMTSPAASEVVKIVVILAAACALTVLTSRQATLEQALFTGVVWGVLCIAAEIFASADFGHPWFDLLGSPARPVLRDLLLVTWVFAPALFARRRA